MKNLVLYTSKYGSTKQYAQWIGEALHCPVDEFANLDHYDLNDVDTIICGEGVYAGRLKSPKSLQEIIRKYPDKNYVFFLVGLADANDAENRDRLYADLKKYLDDDIEKIKVFFLRGAIDYSKLSFMDRSMMWMLYQTLKHKPKDELPEDAQQAIETYGKKVDFVDKAAIKPIIDYIHA